MNPQKTISKNKKLLLPLYFINAKIYNMKKIVFLLILCGFWLVSFSQSGSLTVASSSNQRFWLFIDDILQNEMSVTSIQVMRMQLQTYKVRVEMDNRDANCVGQRITITNQRGGVNYVISYRNNCYVLNMGQVSVRPVLSQNLIQFGNRPDHGGNQDGHRPPGGQGHGQQDNFHSPCRNTSEFSIALESIKKENFESGKLQFAKNMTMAGPICVEQIIQVCNVFNQESSKLEYAKFAYQYCGDKNLYYLVNNVFTFQSSKNELSNFIR